MKKILRRSLCCLLSIVLAFSTIVTAVAYDEDAQTSPVIVVNDINLNPIRNTDDGSVVFSFSDYQFDPLFTTGFSENITDLFTKETIEEITNGDLAALEIVTLLLDYFGFSGDVNRIINTVLDLIMKVSENLAGSGIDIQELISNINFESFAADLKNKLAGKLEEIKLLSMNPDGTPLYENIGAVVYEDSLEYLYEEYEDLAYEIAGEIADSIAEAIGYENTFIFNYDWRLDPAVNAQLLAEFVETIKDATGADEVLIISEGYGSVIATEYLAEYAEDAAESVKNFVTVSSEFLGTSLVGDFFKGDIVNQASDLNAYTSAYLRYMNDVSDNPITAFVMWLLNYIMNTERELHTFCFEIEKILSDVNTVMNITGITEQIALMPGMWALVPSEDYYEASENLFNDSTDAALLESVEAFKDNQDNYEDILIDAQYNGINVAVVAAWDLQIMPIGKNSSVQSDGVVDTAYASFGASCIDLNSVAEAMEAVQWADDGHDHMSASYDMLTPWYAYGGICAYVDASTCALPENTWFIKNMKHGTFSYSSNASEFLVWLVTAEEQKTVWDDVAYKQFMTYNRYIEPGVLSSDGTKAPDDLTNGGFLLGDVDLDGIITSFDAYMAMSEDLDPESVSFKNADIDGDGEITHDDAERILGISAGIDTEMAAGVKTEYDTEDSGLEMSEYEIELTPVYNSATNQLEVTLTLLDAKGSYCGNFIVNYDTDMLTYSKAVAYEVEKGRISAGNINAAENAVACAFSVEKPLTKKTCDENGNLVLATFYFDVSRTDITATTLTAGTSYFYEDDELVYIDECTLELDEDFFFMLGDVDNNRWISAADARSIIRIAAQLDEVEDELMFARCDVDQDGYITAKDARLVLRASAKLITSFDQ